MPKIHLLIRGLTYNFLSLISPPSSFFIEYLFLKLGFITQTIF